RGLGAQLGRWLWGCGSRLSWALLGRIFGRRRTPHRACMAMTVQPSNDQNQSVVRAGAESEVARWRRGGRGGEGGAGRPGGARRAGRGASRRRPGGGEAVTSWDADGRRRRSSEKHEGASMAAQGRSSPSTDPSATDPTSPGGASRTGETPRAARGRRRRLDTV